MIYFFVVSLIVGSWFLVLGCWGKEKCVVNTAADEKKVILFSRYIICTFVMRNSSLEVLFFHWFWLRR